MNIKFILIALVFFLVPEVSVSLLLDDLNSNQNITILEEELEAEMFSSSGEDKVTDNDGPFGSSNQALPNAIKEITLQHYFQLTLSAVEFWIVSNKNPKYIEYGSLKLYC